MGKSNAAISRRLMFFFIQIPPLLIFYIKSYGIASRKILNYGTGEKKEICLFRRKEILAFFAFFIYNKMISFTYF